jgi:hypothetical protein
MARESEPRGKKRANIRTTRVEKKGEEYIGNLRTAVGDMAFRVPDKTQMSELDNLSATTCTRGGVTTEGTNRSRMGGRRRYLHLRKVVKTRRDIAMTEILPKCRRWTGWDGDEDDGDPVDRGGSTDAATILHALTTR